MPEHLIRLRGAWDWTAPDGPRRVDLPATWPAGLAGPLVLARRFQRPRIDPDREALALRLEAVPGLLRVRLNGVEIGGPAAGEIPLGDLPARNLLELEADPAGLGAGPWGAIALVIRAR